MSSPRIAVIIPAYNEDASIGKVIADIPAALGATVIVGDNGSTDRTAQIAREAGGRVVSEDRRGYGYACLAALAEADRLDPPPDIIVFLDGDYSDHPDEMPALVRPIIEDGCDLVIGSRTLGKHEPGALLPQARFGNWLATTLIRWFFGVCFTDLGPFRAIRYPALQALEMRDTTYGWTVEMQVKAAIQGLAVTEVPVSYRKRIGVSKITGTVKGTVLAAVKIIGTILWAALFWRGMQSA